MKKLKLYMLSSAVAIGLAGCNTKNKDNQKETATAEAGADSVTTAGAASDSLPAPFATEPTAKISKVIGWPAGKTPTAPAGFTVTKFAAALQNPRWIYVAPNGDVFV